MREIKFRVWCKNNKEWEKHYCEIGKDGALWHRDKSGIHIINKKTHIIQFYTGLKDAKNCEIFEGDIVKWYKEWEWVISGDKNVIEYALFQVVFENGAFWVRMIEEDYEDRNCRLVRSACEDKFGDIEVPMCEVVGNIYENPELLETK